MPFVMPDTLGENYEIVVVGTGFGSLFFLQKLLARRRSTSRILVLEWGQRHSHAWQIEQRRNSAIDHAATFESRADEKPWYYTLALGGGTLCWAAQAPRFHPDDFRLQTLYGRGRDWPLSYADLEPYYLEAEKTMLVAGSDDMAALYPRSGAFPMPPHRYSTADEMMKKAQPGLHFPYPLARLSEPVGQRPACCGSTTCDLCPVDAKFTALNGMADVIEHPDLDICLGARVRRLDITNGMVKSIHFTAGGRDRKVSADLVALGANAIQTPHILKLSGVDHPALGRYLHEKIQVPVEVMLDGVDHFNGSSSVSGMNLSLLHGAHRRTHAGAVVRFENPWPYNLRTEYGRWRQVLPLSLLVETEPMEANRVDLGSSDDRPVVRHPEISAYGLEGFAFAKENLAKVLAPLPVERIDVGSPIPTGYHVQGTTRMGTDRSDSIVDANLVAHDIRNLLILGTAVMPTCGSVNPSLTAAALSLRAAERLG